VGGGKGRSFGVGFVVIVGGRGGWMGFGGSEGGWRGFEYCGLWGGWVFVGVLWRVGGG